MFINKVIITSLLLLSFIVSGCAENVSPNTSRAEDLHAVNSTATGVIVGKRAVTIEADKGVGGVGGAVAGGLAGSLVGGNAVTSIIGTVGGAVIGGVAGNAIDKKINTHNAFEYIVKLKNGSMVSVTQVSDLQFSLRQRVIVIYGSKPRIIADDTVNA